MATVYIALGSNLGKRKENCLKAIKYIHELPFTKVLKTSSFIETKPLGKRDQPQFLNGAIKIETKLSPQKLMQSLLEIEKKMGRVRKEKWGPRLIDLDIIIYDDLKIEEPGLTIPHPHFKERDFVLIPLRELQFDLNSLD
ncbi:MAG: 2-amino-4-hydroxy-6-hydroxymethyldihydropteridine diphosphokinase [Deltaproteobacteria bacterium]|nr:2-amino-4-hydroxy-6-hydroxymethyldihydropteridine diphosphokinase [Deltaproteobacteria bacterium]